MGKTQRTAAPYFRQSFEIPRGSTDQNRLTAAILFFFARPPVLSSIFLSGADTHEVEHVRNGRKKPPRSCSDAIFANSIL